MSDGIKRTVLGVGYNSGGKHTAYIVKTPTKEYTTWKNMLRRCYCEKAHKLQPSYMTFRFLLNGYPTTSITV